MSEQSAQLILCCHNRDLGPCLVKCLKKCPGTQELRVIHHHFLAGFRIQKEVSRNSVNLRWDARGNREIIRICEAGDNALSAQVRTRFQHLLREGHVAPCDRFFDVLRLGAINTDGHERLPRPGVFSAVYSQW